MSRFLYHVTCPFHEGDDCPSLAIYSNGTAYCFACGVYCRVSEVGDLLDLRRKARKYYGVRRRAMSQLYRAIRLCGGDLDWQARVFASQLTEEGYRYWCQGRGLFTWVVQRYMIGWTGKFYSIPVMRGGKVVTMAFRRHESDTESMKYVVLKGTEPMLYNLDNCSGDTVFITEGFVDCLTLHQMGFPSVCSVTGSVSGFREEFLASLRGKRLVVVFDNDVAGRYGVERLVGMDRGIRVAYVPERYKDVNEFWTDLRASGDTRGFREYFMKFLC